MKNKNYKGTLVTKRSGWFTIIATLSVIGTMMAGLLTTFLSGPVMGSNGLIQASAGLISFALIYVASDIISEIYGYKASRLVAFINLGSSLVLSALIFLGGVFSTFIDGNANGELMRQVAEAFFNMDFKIFKFNLGNGGVPAAGLIILAWGWIVAMVGDWMNDLVFKHLKSKDGKNKFFKRSFLSSAVGQFVDVLIFVPVLVAVVIPPFAWFGGQPDFITFNHVAGNYFVSTALMMFWQLVFKLGVEVVCYPLARSIKARMHKIEGDDAYEISNSNHILG